GTIASSLAATDAAGSQLNATGNPVALDTDSDQTASLAVADTADHVINGAEAATVAFTVGGLDDETGTATFTDGTNVVTVPVNGSPGERRVRTPREAGPAPRRL